MLGAGVVTALLFIISLVAMIEFPEAFKLIAWGMMGFAVLFFLLRTVYHFRITFKVSEGRKNDTRKEASGPVR